jgi:hypothetical protein
VAPESRGAASFQRQTKFQGQSQDQQTEEANNGFVLQGQGHEFEDSTIVGHPESRTLGEGAQRPAVFLPGDPVQEEALFRRTLHCGHGLPLQFRGVLPRSQKAIEGSS